MTLFDELRAHKWIAARGLQMGWVLWILSLGLFFPYASRYFFVFTAPKPFPVNRQTASPDFFVRGFGTSFSWSDPIGSASSQMWMPIGAPRGRGGLSDPAVFSFGIVLPFIIAAVCALLLALFHRNQQRAAVFLFGGSIVLVYFLLFIRFAAIGGSSAAFALGGPLFLYVAALVLGIVLGGGLPRLFSQRERRLPT